MREFKQTEGYISRIQSARTPESVCEALLSVTERFGLTAVCAGTLPKPGASPPEQLCNLILTSWSSAWIDRYVGQGYIYDDPVVLHMRKNGLSLRWRNLGALQELDDVAQNIMAEASDFGICDGVSFKLTTLEGSPVIISFAGERIELSDADLNTVLFLSSFAVSHLLALRCSGKLSELTAIERECVHWIARGRSINELSELLGVDTGSARRHLRRVREKLGPGNALFRYAVPVQLTPREKECLQWAAEGKSEWEMSQILGISEHTAEKHLLKAKTKLGASNRVQAVAEAMRFGILD